MEQLNTQMSASEKLAVDNAVNTFNKSIVQNGRQVSNELGKDDFESRSNKSYGKYWIYFPNGSIFFVGTNDKYEYII